MIKQAYSILDGVDKSYEYIDDGSPTAQGGVKDIYFSPDKTYVVGFYRGKLSSNEIERLKRITTQYYDSFFNRSNGSCYKKLYAWPTDVVINDSSSIGVIVPHYGSEYFFEKGYENFDTIKGEEKQGKWFASPKFRSKGSRFKLDDSELGNWLSYFQICVNIARGVKRMHGAGLAHSDLSYKNVLINPANKSAKIIDIDGLVVPGLFAPDVVGTPDFIAPEVMKSIHLPIDDENRQLPNRETDLHALAVLIYMYLLYRHPLRGGQFFGADIDTEDEENLMMGEKALFVEHPTNDANRNFKREYGEDEIKKSDPYLDLKKTPYTITGPYLKDLFDKAFIEGLHNPAKRPPAQIWEQAIIKTNDLKLKCSNDECPQKWFIYNNTIKTACPFCGTLYKHSIPVLDFYSQNKKDTWSSDNLRMVIYHNSTLHYWHTDKSVIRDERLTDDKKIRLGYFSFYNNNWYFINEHINNMYDITNKVKINKNSMVLLANNLKLRFGNQRNDRLALITIIDNSTQRRSK